MGIGIVGGISEGDYTNWTWKWTKKPTSGINSTGDIDALIDEKNNVIIVNWADNSNKTRVGMYNISDFSVVYESPTGSDYTLGSTENTRKQGFHFGMVNLYYGGRSRSQQTYILLERVDYDTIEVWRGGAARLWYRSTAADFGRAVWPDAGAISILGKYILIVVRDKTAPYDTYLMLYEGA